MKRSFIVSIAIILLSSISFLAKNNATTLSKKDVQGLRIAATPKISDAEKKTYLVTRVVDGDTFKVDINGISETVRMIGVDTPEVVDPRKPVQCFGKEASNKAKEILADKRVNLESDQSQSDRDKYKRLLRYAFLEDGMFVNKVLISEGYAHEYTYQSNPYKYQLEFKQAEKQARDEKRGLWAENVCP